MQLTDAWEEKYQSRTTAWEDEETAASTKALIREHLLPGSSVLELGCGRGVDSIWLAEQGYRVVACDVSETAIQEAEARAQAAGADVAFHVADVMADHTMLPRCNLVFERGLLHTFVTDEGRALFARTVADLLEPGQLWLSIAGAAATRAEAAEAARQQIARISAS